MKMNGMKMSYYWVVNFIFDFFTYSLTIVWFCLFGYYVMSLKTFTQTSIGLQIVTFVGWGLAQISMSYFLYPFMHKAYSASLVGYIIALWCTVIAVTLNISMFEFPKQMSTSLNVIPFFSFSRIYYRIAQRWAN